MSEKTHSQLPFVPRFIRIRDAPFYLGMDKNRFNAEVRPALTEIKIGTQGIAFDRIELDAWADEIVARARQTSIQKQEQPAWQKNQQGLREQELTQLQWSEENRKLGVFVLPGDRTKNNEDRIVPLNSKALAIINAQRGKYVFTFKGDPVQRINGHAWRKARKRAGLEQCRVHDLRHTFGRRLRAAGVSFENRQDLLGHKSNRITDHYCKAELEELQAAVERLCSL